MNQSLAVATRKRSNEQDIDADIPPLQRKWITFCLIWIAIGFGVMIFMRIKYGALSKAQMTILWAIIGVPPFISGMIVKQLIKPAKK